MPVTRRREQVALGDVGVDGRLRPAAAAAPTSPRPPGSSTGRATPALVRACRPRTGAAPPRCCPAARPPGGLRPGLRVSHGAASWWQGLGTPSSASSWACVPRSTTAPRSSTRISSACSSTLVRCDTITVVAGRFIRPPPASSWSPRIAATRRLLGALVDRRQHVVEQQQPSARGSSVRASAVRWRCPARQHHPALADHGVEPLGQRANVVDQAGRAAPAAAAGRPPGRPGATTRPSQPPSSPRTCPPARRAGGCCGRSVMERVLRHHREPGADLVQRQGRERPCRPTSTVPTGGVYTRQQVDQRRLAGAGAAEDPERPAGRQRERDVAQRRLLRPG